MTGWLTYRTVVLDSIAQSVVDANTIPGNRFEDAWRGIEWLVCRRPDVGIPKDASRPTEFLVLVVAGSAAAGTKEVWILYSYDIAQVTIHGVRVV